MFDTQYDYQTEMRTSIPEDLDDMKPGRVLARTLAGIDVTEVSGYDRVVVLRAYQRMASFYQAELYRAMAAIRDVMVEDHGDTVDEAFDAGASEIRASLGLTRRSSEDELAFALQLHERLPKLAIMLSSGQIDVRRAKVMDRYTMHLSPSAANRVLDTISDEAPSLTTGQITAKLRRLCIDENPEESTDLYEAAVAGRHIWVSPTEAGTANFFGRDLPPDRVAAISNRIHMIARSLRGGGEVRSMQQLSADVFLELLEGRHQEGSGGVVDIRVDLDTLAGLVDHAGDLAGFGPVIADVARNVADENRDAEWRVVVTDPTTGEPIHVGVTKRRPTARQRRFVEARDPTCVFPGCRMAARSSDIDHRIPYAEGGHTEACCLAPLCRHDHRIRHANGWTYRRLESGAYQWTTRLGHTYTTPTRGSTKPP